MSEEKSKCVAVNQGTISEMPAHLLIC
uniref:Uncharacterized protein n=1 Tax=Anguilla anguilla TaxID=7936 RepID=A0A0E9VVB4_ANGAN